MEKNWLDALMQKNDYSAFLSKQIKTKDFVGQLIKDEKKR